MGPEEGHKDNQGAGALLLGRQADRVGDIQPKEQKTPGQKTLCLVR